MSEIDKDFFKYDQKENRNKTIDEELKSDEIVLFRAKPKKSAYILEAFFKMLPIAIIWLAFDTFFIIEFLSMGAEQLGPFVIFIIFFFIVHLTPVWIWLGGLIKATAGYKNIEYAITDKRILVRDGILNVEIKSLEFKNIASFNISKSLSDQMLHVGDIIVICGTERVVIHDIENPAFILEKLKQLAEKNKIDISFPQGIKPEVDEKRKKVQSKCPACGAARNSPDDKCEYCGYVFPKY